MIHGLLSSIWWLLSTFVMWLLSPIPLAVIVITFCIVYYMLTINYDYWPSRGVPGPKPKFPWGTSFGPPFLISLRKFQQWLYAEHGGKKFCGYIELRRPVLFVGDLDLIKCITIKDFEHFTDRRRLLLTEEFKKVVFSLKGQEWKDTRSAMTPTFSASKLKGMHQICLENANNLSKYMREEMQTKPEIELRNAMSRFTMDNIAACAFGVNCNSFTDPNSEFVQKASMLFKPPAGFQAFRFISFILCGEWVTKYLPDPMSDIARFFSNVVTKTREHRDATGEKRKDFLQLLLDTKDKDGNRLLTEESIMAQCVLFFIVGHDTTASLLTFCAYSLATSPEWQRKVQQEIDQVLQQYDGKITYEAINEMCVLENVMAETLRLYPPVVGLERICTKDYVLPGANLKIPKGSLVQMPIHALHRDPKIYPDPLKFDPDRFLPEAREARHPCAYMPFGSGPRTCIAMRFALFETKVALVAALKENNLEPGPSTPPPPMPLRERSLILAPKEGCGYIRVVPRRNAERD